MATTITVILNSEDDGWLGDTSGLDWPETLERYIVLLTNALEAAFPDADVDVRPQRGGAAAGRDIQITTAPVGEPPAPDLSAEDALRERVAEIMQAVTEGRHGEYAAETEDADPAPQP